MRSATPARDSDSNGRTALSTADALAFAGFEQIDGVQVIGTEEQSGIDRLVAFAVRLPPAKLPQFLAAAGFDPARLREGDRVFQKPIAGIDVEHARRVAAGQDLLSRDGRTIVRDVMLVRDDETALILLVWAYTT